MPTRSGEDVDLVSSAVVPQGCGGHGQAEQGAPVLPPWQATLSAPSSAVGRLSSSTQLAEVPDLSLQACQLLAERQMAQHFNCMYPNSAKLDVVRKKMEQSLLARMSARAGWLTWPRRSLHIVAW